MARSNEKFYVRYGWLILAISALLGLGAGIYLALFPAPVDLPGVVNLTGQSWNDLVAHSPEAVKLTRYFISLFWIADATVYGMSLVIAVTLYRKGERWAWYVSWLVVPYGVAFIAISAAAGGTMWANWTVHLALELLGLVLPCRQFFPANRQPSSPREKSWEGIYPAHRNTPGR